MLPRDYGRDPGHGTNIVDEIDEQFPGADRPDADDPQGDLPERLAQGMDDGPGTGIATGEPDLKTDVEPPDESM